MTSSDAAALAIGRSLVAVLLPVSTTIFVVVWANLSLSPICAAFQQALTVHGDSQSQDESVMDKLISSMEDAASFIAIIFAMTLLIYLLYKYRCTITLYGFLIIVSCIAFAQPLWILLDLTFTRFQIPYTSVFMAALLWNIATVAVLSVFYYCHPVVAQINLIIYSIISAWMLTCLSEWTTWCVLICISLYDIFAVLYAHGPLRLLVNLADHRNESLPGFVYNSVNRVAPIRKQNCTEYDTIISPTTDVSQARSGASVTETGRGSTTSSPSIRLGLGDFIFYSVLVAKASNFGFVPYMFCLIAVLTGLIAVIILQISMTTRTALPALPISIFVGAVVFFAYRCSIASMNEYLSVGGVAL